MHILFVLIAVGLLVLLTGIFTSKYPRESRYLTLKGFSLESIAENRVVKRILGVFTRDKSFILNRISLSVINGSETKISLEAFYLVKIFSFILITLSALIINYTNMDITKVNIISKASNSINIFGVYQEDKSDAEYNYSLYHSILNQIDSNDFEKADDAEKRQMVSEVLPVLIHTVQKQDVEFNAEKFISTYKAMKKVKLVDRKVYLIAFIAYFVPELLLLLKRLLLGSIYRKEVIKLENIFELLGSMEGFKTTDILEQMSKGSSLYRKNMTECRSLFQIDRKLAVQNLKAATKNKKMSELVDTLRIYSIVDKKLAMDILAKNRKSRNDGILITADEDMDWIDIIAFISITPLLYELANLLMKPMLDMIFDAFKYI